MLENWKDRFSHFYRNLPLKNRQGLRRQMFMQIALSLVLVWMTLRGGPGLRGWFLFFLVCTAIAMILLQWMRAADRQDRERAPIVQSTEGNQRKPDDASPPQAG